MDEEGSEGNGSRTSSVGGADAGDKRNKKSVKQKPENKDKDKGGVFKGWGNMFR